jgi:hypothetical protein
VDHAPQPSAVAPVWGLRSTVSVQRALRRDPETPFQSVRDLTMILDGGGGPRRHAAIGWHRDRRAPQAPGPSSSAGTITTEVSISDRTHRVPQARRPARASRPRPSRPFSGSARAVPAPRLLWMAPTPAGRRRAIPRTPAALHRAAFLSAILAIAIFAGCMLFRFLQNTAPEGRRGPGFLGCQRSSDPPVPSSPPCGPQRFPTDRSDRSALFPRRPHAEAPRLNPQAPKPVRRGRTKAIRRSLPPASLSPDLANSLAITHPWRKSIS